MEALLFDIGVIGNIISVLVFLSPIKTFWRIVTSRSTEEFEPFPYVATLLNSSLWVYYGITKPDGFLIATVNGFGIVMESIYIIIFLVFAGSPSLRKKTAIMAGTLDVVVLAGIILVTKLAIDDESLRLTIIGILCACLNVFMYGSPLAAMRTVITTKSVEYMPFFLSFFLFLNGGVWTTYAVIDKDIFLGIPNGIGFVLGVFQLILYMMYMNTKAEWQNQPLIDPKGTNTRDEEEG